MLKVSLGHGHFEVNVDMRHFSFCIIDEMPGKHRKLSCVGSTITRSWELN
jgi:hypothetical protein